MKSLGKSLDWMDEWLDINHQYDDVFADSIHQKLFYELEHYFRDSLWFSLKDSLRRSI